MSDRQTIHVKCQDLFSEKYQKVEMSSAALVIGTLRIRGGFALILILGTDTLILGA